MSTPSLHRCLLLPPAPLSLVRCKRRPVKCANDREALFSRIAPVYDNLNDVLSLGQHRIWKRMAVSWSGAKKSDNVLDVCCGSGDLAFLLSERVGPSGKVVGLDFSNKQLSIALSRQHSRSNNCYGNIKWVEGNALDLPFPESYFDSVTIGYGLRNVLDRHKALKEVHRVLRPGCNVSVLDFNKSTDLLAASVQDLMIDYIVVPVANIYGLADEYRYLKNSIKEYLTGEELEELALEVGFSMAKYYVIGAGLMGNLVATRLRYGGSITIRDPRPRPRLP